MDRNIWKAKNDYICEHCRKIIQKDERYVDYTYSSRNSRDELSWHHYRYHLGCDGTTKASDKKTLFEKIQAKLIDEGAFPMARHDVKHYGEKCWIVGIVVNWGKKHYVHCVEWDKSKSYYVTEEFFKEHFHDYNGNSL